MKILFLFHPYANVGMTEAFRAVAESVFCPMKRRYPTPPGSRRMGWSEFLSLRRRIRAREFDLIIAYGCEETLWRPNRSFFGNVYTAVKKLLFYFPAIALRLLLPTIKSSGTRLVIYDYDDLTIIPKIRWPYLDVCHRYFKVHPPVNLSKSFLFQTPRDGSLYNTLRNPTYNLWIKKIEPISYGTDYRDYYDTSLATEKKYDVFFSGRIHYSQVRQEGLQILEELRAEGYNICIPERVPHRDFLRLCSESWLTLSPEGAEWDSARHYESLLMKSVPVINYPNVRRHRPLLDGVHVIYYPPEDGLLADVIRRALQDKARLQQIADAGREHVLRYHLHSKLVEHIVDRSTQPPAAQGIPRASATSAEPPVEPVGSGPATIEL